MGLPKFFVAPGSVRGSFLTLEGENAAHARVLRLRQGDRVLVCDGCGTDYSCTISDISPQQVCLVVDSASASASEPRVQCSVYMAIGIVIADALLGEITPAMATAVCQSHATRVLIPVNHCENYIVGVPEQPISDLVAAAVQKVKALCAGEGCGKRAY